MQAAEEDRAGLAPDSEFVATGKITVEPVPHTEPLGLWVLTLRQESCRLKSFVFSAFTRRRIRATRAPPGGVLELHSRGCAPTHAFAMRQHARFCNKLPGF